jgi:hypothetical protein
LRDNPCDGTPTADTVAVMTGGVIAPDLQKYTFCFHNLAVHGRSDTLQYLSLQLRWRQWEYHHMGYRDLSNNGAS